MQGIKIIGDDVLGQDSPGATLIRGDSRSVGNGLAWALHVPFSFTPFWNRSMSDSPVPTRAFVLCSPLRLSIMPSGGDFFHLRPLQAAKSGCPVPPWLKVNFRETTPPPHSMDGGRWWGHLRVNLGYSGSSLSSWLFLSPANLLYRENFT